MPTGIDLTRKNYPDKHYLIIGIATLSRGQDEIFEKNYQPAPKEKRGYVPEEVMLVNNDGFFDDLPDSLFAKHGGRAMVMGVLDKETKIKAQIKLAEQRLERQKFKAE